MSRLNTNIDFLIVTALEIERDAIIDQIGNFEKIQIDNEIPTYYQTEIHLPNKIETCKVALVVLLGMGNVQAGVLSGKVIEKLHPEHVIMLGIAGGISKNKVKIGDIVVATSIKYYEKGKFFSRKFQLRGEGALTAAKFIDRFINFKDKNWIDEISIDPPENPYNPNIHFGTIASGEKVIASKRFIKWLLKYYPKMKAVEMESWGVLIAAWMSKTLPNFITVRGISDNADKLKGDNWQKFAAHTAALYLKHFLQSQTDVPRKGYLPINEFKRIDKVYVPPLEFEEILKTLEEKRIVLITGTPEYGKTFTAIYLMLKYYNLGYKPEWIPGGERGERLVVRSRLHKMEDLELEAETKKILYFEDPFGKLKYEERYDLERKITSILEEIKNVKDLYVIITSREEVFKEFKEKAFSGMRLEAFEKRLSIGKPSYTPEKRKEILRNWATFFKCTWLNSEELKNFVLDKIESEYNLPTPLNIRNFVRESISVNQKEQLRTKIKEISMGTTYAFLKEIKEMTNDKVLFLTILYVLENAREEFIKETYQNLIKSLKIEYAKKFEDVFNWFKEDKIEITYQKWFKKDKIEIANTIKFSHSSYFEAIEALISEGDDYNIIFIRLLKYLAGKDEAARAVAFALVKNFNMLPENVREQLLLTLAEKDEATRAVAFAIVHNFNELPESVRQILFTFAEKKETAGFVAYIIVHNFNELPESVRQILFTLAEKDETARAVAYIIVNNFNELPEEVRQILFTLAEKDEITRAVAFDIVHNFNELPESVRQILYTLAEKDEVAKAIAFDIVHNFNERPESVRQILYTLAKKDEVAKAIAFDIVHDFNERPEKVRQILYTLAEKDEVAKTIAYIIVHDFNELPESVRQILYTLAEKDEVAKVIAFDIVHNFNERPESVRQILYTLAKKDEVAKAIAFDIVHDFNERPEKVRQILYTLAEKDEVAKTIAYIIVHDFNELPEEVRQILYTLAEKDETAGFVALAIEDNFNELPEIIRYELLINLSNIKSAQKIIAHILKLRYNQIPDQLRKEINNGLKIKDEED